MPLFKIAGHDIDIIRPKKLAYRLPRYKKEDNPLAESHIPHTGWIRECDSCSGYAEEEVPHGGEYHLLCAS